MFFWWSAFFIICSSGPVSSGFSGWFLLDFSVFFLTLFRLTESVDSGEDDRWMKIFLRSLQADGTESGLSFLAGGSGAIGRIRAGGIATPKEIRQQSTSAQPASAGLVEAGQ
jgi:hypothetical protein